jgi:hypothetical protein
MRLNERFSVDIEAISPYSFELTLGKPAGWWWSTPGEECKNSTCLSATRFNGKLLGLKLTSTGTIQKPKISCTIYSKTKTDKDEKQLIARMLKRSLKTDEDLSDFYNFSEKDPILGGVVKDLCGSIRLVGQSCFQR